MVNRESLPPVFAYAYVECQETFSGRPRWYGTNIYESFQLNGFDPEQKCSIKSRASVILIDASKQLPTLANRIDSFLIQFDGSGIILAKTSAQVASHNPASKVHMKVTIKIVRTGVCGVPYMHSKCRAGPAPSSGVNLLDSLMEYIIDALVRPSTALPFGDLHFHYMK